MIVKYIKWTLGTLGFALAMLMAKKSHGADATGIARLVDSFTVAPVAAVQTAGFNGESKFGAGLDLGVGLNKFVSVHVTGLTYETDDWRSSAVDESEAYVQADLTKFSLNSLVPYVKGGGVADWNEGDFGLGVGAGARFQFNKTVSLGADYTLRAWLADREPESLIRSYVQFKF